MNRKRGFRRIMWVLSVLAFVIPAIIYAKDYITSGIGDTLDFMGFVFGRGIIGLIVVWAIYVVTLFIAKGFCDDEQKQ